MRHNPQPRGASKLTCLQSVPLKESTLKADDDTAGRLSRVSRIPDEEVLRRRMDLGWTARLKFSAQTDWPPYGPMATRMLERPPLLWFSTRLVVSSKQGNILATADTTWAVSSTRETSPEENHRTKEQLKAALRAEVSDQDFAAKKGYSELLFLTNAVKALEWATWKNPQATENVGSAAVTDTDAAEAASTVLEAQDAPEDGVEVTTPKLRP